MPQRPPPTDYDEPPAAPPPGSTPARNFGAPRAAAVPRMEHVRVTAPDLARRAALEKTRGRLLVAAGVFGVLFAAVIGKLADATVIQPMHPREAQLGERRVGATAARDVVAPADHHRATITDRNGQVLAVSLATAEVYADPRQMIDTDEAAHRLADALPQVDAAELAARLASAKQFVYVARRITPQQEQAVNALGIPGIDFRSSERREYPLGRVAAQVLGGVDVDQAGVAGVERFFDGRLRGDPRPLRLSVDLRVQAVVREELLAAMTEFTAIGAAGIVMDVNTGEIVAMVSLPDYDANGFGAAPAAERFNRAVTGMYEPGSTFKLQTAAMALDAGAVNIWNEFDASHDIHIGRFTISDFQGKHRWLYLPEVLAYSSNLGAAHIAQVVGAERQRAWLGHMGMFQKVGVELPEAGMPIVPTAARWSAITTMTVGFGHGIAISPLHVVRGTAALANGGMVLRPTLLAQSQAGIAHEQAGLARAEPGPGATDVAATIGGAVAINPDGSDSDAPAPGAMPAEPAMNPPVALNARMMQTATSDTVRRLMRLVVTDGYGKPAEVPGYYVGGKTGTAEKVGAHGAYEKHANVSAFICVFPMNKPRYAVYMMLDEPHGNASTGFYSTAGAVSAPAAGRVIARIAPMLGLFPDLADAPAINAGLAIAMEPARPSGARAELAPTLPAAAARRDHKHEAAIAPSLMHATLVHETAYLSPAHVNAGAAGDGPVR